MDMDARSIEKQLDIEMERLFKSFEEDEERTRRLAAALEHESTATSLHFALFPRKTRDGGLQPTCREPVVSMMAFVVDLFSPHDGSIDLLVLSECFLGSDFVVNEVSDLCTFVCICLSVYFYVCSYVHLRVYLAVCIVLCICICAPHSQHECSGANSSLALAESKEKNRW